MEFNINKIKTFSLMKFKKVVGAYPEYEKYTDAEMKKLYEKLTGKKIKEIENND